MPDAAEGSSLPSVPSASEAIPEVKGEPVELVRRILKEETRLQAKDLERVTHKITSVTLATWSGPLPPPSVLREFEDVVPGSAASIVATFTSEVSHRQSMERKGFTLTGWGMALGFVGLIAMLGLAAYALICGHPWVAGTIATVMTSVVGLFVWKQQTNSTPSQPSAPRRNAGPNRAARRAAERSNARAKPEAS